MANIVYKFQVPSFHGLVVMMFWRLGGKGSLTDWLTYLISDGGVCRTAPATAGLLNILIKLLFKFSFSQLANPGLNRPVLRSKYNYQPCKVKKMPPIFRLKPAEPGSCYLSLCWPGGRGGGVALEGFEMGLTAYKLIWLNISGKNRIYLDLTDYNWI